MLTRAALILAAGMSCATSEQVAAKLTGLGEERTGVGLSTKGGSQNGSLFEVWASSATGTWTIVMTHPQGYSCIMAYGQGWQDMEAQTPAGVVL